MAKSVNAAALPKNGMGLQIIHEIMDKVDYVSDGSVNRLVLSKELAVSA